MKAVRGFILLTTMLLLFVASGYAVTLHVTDDTKSVSINNFRVSKGLGQDGIVPFPMEGIALKIHAAQRVITDAAAFYIAFGVKTGGD